MTHTYYERQNDVAEYQGDGGDFRYAKFSEAWNMTVLSLLKFWSLYVRSCYIKMLQPIL
jgi:hypothetical protein